MLLLASALAAPLTPAPDSAGLPTALPAWSMLVQDLDGDGAVDLAAASHGTLPLWYHLDGQGTFRPHETDPWNGERADRHGITACDLDSDGAFELVVARGGARGAGGTPIEIWENEDGTWVDRGERLAGTDGVRMRGLSCVDVDGDGDAELYVPGHEGKKADQLWWRGDDGEWEDRAAQWGLQRKESTYGGAWLDLDGDRDMDLVRLEDGDVGILLQSQGTMVRTASPKLTAVRDLGVIDLENDGDADLYLGRAGYFRDATGDWGARLYLDEGDVDRVTWKFPQDCSVVRVRVQGEIGGEGARMVTPVDADRLQARLRFEPDYSLEPEGDGMAAWVSPVRRLLHVRAGGGAGRVQVGLECVEGVGDPVLIEDDTESTGEQPGRVDKILVNDGLGRFTLIEAPGKESGDVQVLDVDLDGDDDLFLVSETVAGTWRNGPDSLLLNEGGVLTPVDLADPGAPGKGQLAVAVDLDGDRFPELVVVNGEYDGTLAGRVQVWDNPGVEGHHWIEVEVYEADGVVRSLSARVQVLSGGNVQRRLSAPTPDHRSNGMTSTVYGLGTQRLAQVVVVWPDGTSVVHERVPSGTTLRVVKP